MSLMLFGDKSLDLSLPHVMGILNVTPDSFSDGGAFNSLDAALRQSEKMIQEGGSIIDVGGESTRPGASPVSTQQELDRVLPIVEAIKKRFDIVVSVDTSTPEVIRGSAALGAGLINDVRALERDGALQAAAETGLPICLMHMKGGPQTMQSQAEYVSVVDDVVSYLSSRVELCESVGISRSRLILDPGIGFGKTLSHNLSLLNHTEVFKSLGFEVLIGLSRKTMIGEALGLPVEERLYGTMGANASAYLKGARIFRVHDVKPHVEMLALMSRIEREG
ncbi:dihydropteroate synthase [Marinomonas sp. CT5]|uniref:dihydropteroate synthase n=1 Tax=Marinomonas sp. CT5 TaxID=2066133 RepID=UPI001846BC2A|nr:dihydropteroate synthase [Marinomonas sp. CT5]NVK72784.1 dihydropteroate synthase [Oceanospirillaceae bacterium]QUX94662.1 dihydropteroate synthase [Marinomonas sp. CT5]